MPDTRPVGIILAAGKGTRMKSELPKAIHHAAGLPMAEWVARGMRSVGIERIVIVIGHGGEVVQRALGESYEYVWQHEQLGTGHAALVTADLLGKHDGPVIIAPADAPLLSEEVFKRLLTEHEGFECTFATCDVSDPHGYGRVLRDAAGNPTRIVEERDATREQRTVCEVSAALYCFQGSSLYRELPKLTSDNAQGEFYLPDLVRRLAESGSPVKAVKFADARLLVGVNDRWQLAEVEGFLKVQILRRHALAGVTLMDPSSIFIGPHVEIGTDTVIEPASYLFGRTKIGSGCRIGPSTRIQDCAIGDGTRILMSHLVRAKVGNKVTCGPFANLRPGTRLGDGVKIGNFVEVKNSDLQDNVSASHLTYIGDSDIGAETNVGAGVVTCNFDGFEKFRTTVGKKVFLGSNSTLVAPVTVGDGSLVAAGSTITKDVPEDGAAFGRARQETKEEWAKKWRKKRRPKE